MYILIVSGMSGSGKSTALKLLEDKGFYCVDNLPSSMLSSFCRLCGEANPPIERAAVTVDGRELLLNNGHLDAIAAIDAIPCRKEILFLDARDDVLMKRYNELRRSHPLGENGDAASGVRIEREYLKDMRERADYIMDTSDLKSRDFLPYLLRVLPESGSPETSVILCSFGYKRGVPVDADIVFDMRFIENPFYVPGLRLLSGLDGPVIEFIEKQPELNSLMGGFRDFIVRTLPLYRKQHKAILRVCFGCTGGRHRSVYGAEKCAALLREAGIPVRVLHRDLVTELEDIQSRQ